MKTSILIQNLTAYNFQASTETEYTLETSKLYISVIFDETENYYCVTDLATDEEIEDGNFTKASEILDMLERYLDS